MKTVGTRDEVVRELGLRESRAFAFSALQTTAGNEIASKFLCMTPEKHIVFQRHSVNQNWIFAGGGPVKVIRISSDILMVDVLNSDNEEIQLDADMWFSAITTSPEFSLVTVHYDPHLEDVEFPDIKILNGVTSKCQNDIELAYDLIIKESGMS